MSPRGKSARTPAPERAATHPKLRARPARRTPRLPVRSGLGPHHLAFFRGVVLDGLEPLALAKRYLPVRPLERVVTAHIRWIRDELVGTARRLGALRLATLLARPLPPPLAAAGPTLEQFAAQFPSDFYSEVELLQLFREAYPETAAQRRARGRRAAAVRRLRQALDLLEHWGSVLPPQPSDPVEAWLADGIAGPLRAAGVATLTELATLVDARGARWYTRVPKLGPAKATAVALWLRANVAGFAERVGERALVPYKALRPQLVAGRRAETGIVPFEYFQPTAATDGSRSTLRRPPDAGGLPAVDDRDAVHRWLATHLTPRELKDPLVWDKNATFRAYRREVERLWAWAVVQRSKALSALTDADVTAYQIFLLDPQPRAQWIGPRRPRWHPEWRPFTALPSPRSREHILTVIDALFDWWFRQGYIVRNPWRAGAKRERVERPQFARRSLSLAAWDTLRAQLVGAPRGRSARAPAGAARRALRHRCAARRGGRGGAPGPAFSHRCAGRRPVRTDGARQGPAHARGAAAGTRAGGAAGLL